MPYAIYELPSGRILKVGSSSNERNADAHGGLYTMVPAGFAFDDETHYTLQFAFGPEIVPRPESGISIDKTTILADGVDLSTLTGIPAGSEVWVDGKQIAVDDGVLEIGSDEPGTMEVRVVPPFPAREFEAIVVAS